MELIDKGALYKRTAEWEEQAQAEVLKNKGCRTVEEWDEYKKWLIILNERSSFKYDIADAPTIEAEPIKHGRWETCESGHDAICTNCRKYWIPVEDKYDFWFCPRCGAKMDLKE